jgi:hypothetical protein
MRTMLMPIMPSNSRITISKEGGNKGDSKGNGNRLNRLCVRLARQCRRSRKY